MFAHWLQRAEGSGVDHPFPPSTADQRENRSANRRSPSVSVQARYTVPSGPVAKNGIPLLAAAGGSTRWLAPDPALAEPAASAIENSFRRLTVWLFSMVVAFHQYKHCPLPWADCAL
jgi:hypothetical protein